MPKRIIIEEWVDLLRSEERISEDQKVITILSIKPKTPFLAKEVKNSRVYNAGATPPALKI